MKKTKGLFSALLAVALLAVLALGVFVLEGVKPVKEGVDFNLPIREIVLTEKHFSDCLLQHFITF